MAKTQPPSPVSVFRYVDARQFLCEAYNAEKKQNRNFSHRFIARAMNAGSSSFFKDVLCGRAPLSPERAAKFAKLFRLTPKETDHFQTLVLFTQASTHEEKERYLRKLGGNSANGAKTVLQATQREYLRKWYYAAIRELLDTHDFRGDTEALAKALDPAITPEEASDAVALLLRLGLIRKDAQGRYEKVGEVVGTKAGGDAEMAMPGLKASLELAQRALDAHPPAMRPFSYLTLNVSERTFAEVRDRIRAFRGEILDLVADDSAVDRLYQLNLQFFPLSTPAKRRKA
jgi:uncharacterized protein (TIGR02147 family)